VYDQHVQLLGLHHSQSYYFENSDEKDM
jgi:hypothetical protein